jgi:DNA-binding MarR family transcriptional regulator
MSHKRLAVFDGAVEMAHVATTPAQENRMPAPKKKPADKTAARTERFDDLASQLRPGKDGSRLAASELASSIGFTLRLANGVAMASLAERFEALEMRQSLYSVMLIIHENPGLKQQEVGQTLSIQQPNLVSLVNELVTQGLVQRTINADDRRSYSLVLTPAGRQRLAQAQRAHTENEKQLAQAIAH